MDTCRKYFYPGMSDCCQYLPAATYGVEVILSDSVVKGNNQKTDSESLFTALFKNKVPSPY